MRRRVAALVALLVVVALLVWGLTAWARSGQDPAEEATETSETVASEEDAPSSPPATEPTVPAPEDETSVETTTTTPPASTGTTGAVAASTVARSGACELQDLIVRAISSQPSYPEGTQPLFYMEVENPTDTDCEINLDDNTLRFEVYDMASNDRIWSDTDCYPAVVDGMETFKAGQKRGFEARWSATASQPGQCDTRPAVAPGSYFLHAVIGDNASDAAPFNIS